MYIMHPQTMKKCFRHRTTLVRLKIFILSFEYHINKMAPIPTLFIRSKCSQCVDKYKSRETLFGNHIFKYCYYWSLTGHWLPDLQKSKSINTFCIIKLDKCYNYGLLVRQ